MRSDRRLDLGVVRSPRMSGIARLGESRRSSGMVRDEPVARWVIEREPEHHGHRPVYLLLQLRRTLLSY